MPQRPGVLVPVLFHSLYPGRDELADGSLAPNQDITVQVFRSFVLEMLEAGYTAVTPAQVDAGLDAQARYFMVTFDDGYFNNILALDVLREFRVPATFFISTGHVRDGKSFWWDALGRQLTSAGITGVTQRREIERVKQWTSRGSNRRSLGVLATARSSHAATWTGRSPCKNSRRSRPTPGCIWATTQSIGLRLGFTVTPRHSRLPLDGDRMTIGRFLFHGSRDVRQQCASFGTRAVPSHWLHRVLHAGY